MVSIRPAGQRNTLVTIQRPTTVEDDYGEPIITWSAIGKVWATVIYGRGDERRQAAMEQGEQPATFQLVAGTLTRGLTLRDRLLAKGTVWNIRGVAVDTPQPGTVEVVAVADQDVAA